MDKSLAQQAIDSAFIAHMAKLFEILCSGLVTEASGERDIHSTIPSARARFEEGYRFAAMTHKAMSDITKAAGEAK